MIKYNELFDKIKCWYDCIVEYIAYETNKMAEGLSKL